MAASFSERYGVSSGNAASVAVEQTVNGEITDDDWLALPAAKAATPSTATAPNQARQEIDEGDKDIENDIM